MGISINADHFDCTEVKNNGILASDSAATRKIKFNSIIWILVSKFGTKSKCFTSNFLVEKKTAS